MIVFALPVSQTHVAEVMPTETGHVVAPVVLLDEYLASRTALPALEGALEVAVTGTTMLRQHALSTILSPTSVAGKGILSVDDSFAVLGGTEAQVGVSDGLFPQQEALVPLSVLLGEVKVAEGVRVEGLPALFLRAGDFLHNADLVDDVVVQAPLAELMSALPKASDLLQLVSSLTQLAQRTSESTANDYVLYVVLFYFLLRSRVTQEATLDCFGQFS